MEGRRPPGILAVGWPAIGWSNELLDKIADAFEFSDATVQYRQSRSALLLISKNQQIKP